MKPGLRGFADAKKASVDLLRDIRAHVVADEVKHGEDHRNSDRIHVSELVKDTSCPRYMYYKLSHTEQSDPRGSAYHQLVSIWSAGTAEHEKWQRWLREMGDLWGTWFCLQCLNSWEDTSPESCTSCGGVLLRYDEVGLEDPVYPLVGHADGAVPRLKTLIEIKSFSTGSVRVENARLVGEHTHKIDGRTIIDHEGLWNAVKRPLKSHLVQGLMYLWMCSRMGEPYSQYERILFIYENKTTQATKTFEVKYSERFVKVYFDILDEVVQAVTDGVAPPRPVLFARESKPCSQCPYRTRCWGENSDDDRSEATAVSAGGSVSGGEEVSGEAAVQPSSEAGVPDPADSRGHHRTRRQRVDRSDDTGDPVGRTSRRAVGDGRGGRAVGRSGDGEVPRPRFARRVREGRDPNQG